MGAEALMATGSTILAGLVGAVLGSWLHTLRDDRTRRLAYLREQLDHFYSPMVAMRMQIRSLSETRVRVHDASGAEWEESVAERLGPGQVAPLGEMLKPDLDRLIDEENRKFREELVPLYEKLINLFVDKMWLAEGSTREHFGALVEHVDILRRGLQHALPRGVLQRLDHREERLQPLYDDLTAHFHRLKVELARGWRERATDAFSSWRDRWDL